MITRFIRLASLSLGVWLACATTTTFAQDTSVGQMEENLLNAAPPGSDRELELLCSNIAEPAREKRYALQKAQLEELKTELEQRIERLEAKRVELEAWVARREEFARMANGSLVDVYASMAPDSAAERLANMESGLSAALLLKLKPRGAAAVLAEMDAMKASVITGIMAASADTSLDASQ